MARPVFRLDPKLPAQNMQTYQISAPIQTHRRPARCEEVDCQQQANGWKMLVDQSTNLGRSQAHYIKNQSGRQYVATKLEGGVTELVFSAGQQCFAQHTISLEREANYFVKKGDFRGATLLRKHTRPEHWVEDFSEHQDNIKSIIEKG